MKYSSWERAEKSPISLGNILAATRISECRKTDNNCIKHTDRTGDAAGRRSVVQMAMTPTGRERNRTHGGMMVRGMGEGGMAAEWGGMLARWARQEFLAL